MTLLFMDGFDHYNGSDANLGLGQYLDVSGAMLSATQVRTGTRSARGNASSTCYLSFGFSEQKTEIGFGFGYFFGAAPASNRYIAELSRSSGDYLVPNLRIVHLPSGAIRIERGNSVGVALLETDPSVLNSGVWQHLEFFVSASNTVGELEIRLNEVTIGSVSGVDTVSSESESFAGVRLDVSFFGGTNIRYYDDFFIWDTEGTQNNDFIGDRRVLTLLPNINEATQEMAVSGAANAYTAIQTANGDSSFIIADNDVPVTSEFGLEDVGANVGAISALQLVSLMRKTEAGTVSMQHAMISGGDVVTGSTHPITESYGYYHDVFETNPDTGAPWSTSGVNAATMRLRRTV